MKSVENQKALFLQSEVADPFALYSYKRKHQPLYFDEEAKAWMVYSYKACHDVLSNANAVIPPVQSDFLNESALAILQRLARLKDGDTHEVARESAMILFQSMRQKPVGVLLEKLIGGNSEIDWVDSVCRKLGTMHLLLAMDFSDNDIQFIQEAMPHITKLMLPMKTSHQVDDINRVSEEVFSRVSKHLLHQINMNKVKDKPVFEPNPGENEVVNMLVSNYIGMLIQSNDAIRGLLSNALLHLTKQAIDKMDPLFARKFIIETLRIDPPFHHTRRIAKDDFVVNDITIPRDEIIVVMLASANRDESQFSYPDFFDISRSNNSEYLTFGISRHQCMADSFSINLAIEVFGWLFEKYHVEIYNSDINFEPLANVRLPVSIRMRLTKRN